MTINNFTATLVGAMSISKYYDRNVLLSYTQKQPDLTEQKKRKVSIIIFSNLQKKRSLILLSATTKTRQINNIQSKKNHVFMNSFGFEFYVAVIFRLNGSICNFITTNYTK